MAENANECGFVRRLDTCILCCHTRITTKAVPSVSQTKWAALTAARSGLLFRSVNEPLTRARTHALHISSVFSFATICTVAMAEQ
jgi:hypothetical protein